MKTLFQLCSIVVVAGMGFCISACQDSDQSNRATSDPDSRVVVKLAEGVSIGIAPETLDDLETYRSNADPESARYHLGRKATGEEIAAWDIDILPDGQGLPAGSGTVAEGAALYALNCAVCHGVDGEGVPPNGALVNSGNNGKTIGSFWPYSTTIFDYIRRAMPFSTPGTLTDQEVYSLTAFLLYKNDIISEDTVVDAASLPLVEMPNADKFTPDNREQYNKAH